MAAGLGAPDLAETFAPESRPLASPRGALFILQRVSISLRAHSYAHTCICTHTHTHQHTHTVTLRQARTHTHARIRMHAYMHILSECPDSRPGCPYLCVRTAWCLRLSFVFLLCPFSALVRTTGCLSPSPSLVLAEALHVGSSFSSLVIHIPLLLSSWLSC